MLKREYSNRGDDSPGRKRNENFGTWEELVETGYPVDAGMRECHNTGCSA